MKIKKLTKTLLFIPGFKTLFLKKLQNINTDKYVIDLEDSVPENFKNKARSNLKNIEKFGLRNKDIFVRINLDKKKISDDLKSCAKAKIKSFIIPKIRTSQDINFIEKLIFKHLRIKAYKIYVLIETAMSLVNLKEICSSSKNIKGLIFGAEDYLDDMNNYDFYNSSNINFARSMIPIYAHAFNLDCIDTPFLDLENKNGYENHLKVSKSMGYNGILIVHPKQCLLANKYYRPSLASYKLAKNILRVQKSHKYEKKNISKFRGKLVGPPLVKRAKKILNFFNE